MIALDTHALVWWVSDPKRIPAKARRTIDAALAAPQALIVSSISLWEIAMLLDRGRLMLSVDSSAWLASVEALPSIEFVAVDNRIAVDAVRLHGFPHHDPADRMIVATALSRHATLITADARLRGYHALKTAWD